MSTIMNDGESDTENEGQFQELRAFVNRMEVTQHQKSQQLQALRQSNNDLMVHIQQEDQRLKALQEQKSELEAQYQQKCQEIDDVRTENEGKDEQLEALQEQKRELEAQVQQKSQQLQRLISCIKSLQSDNKSKRDQLQELQEEIDDVRTENEGKDEQLEALQEQNSELEAQNHQRDHEIQELRQQNVAHLLHITELQQQNEAKDEEIQQLTETSWIVERDEITMLDNELGRGAYGWVKEAIFRGSKVAVKCLHNEVISDYNLHIFSREMNMAARCRHPNLLQFIGATRDTERPPFIITELMHTSLRRMLERNQLTSNQIIPILLGVSCGINYLHKNSPPILHRDISSANVLLNPIANNQWLPKLSDFGSFNFVRVSSTINAGNPVYAAPEALDLSRGPQTAAMDVFSFGVLTHEMCTRRQPSGRLSVTTVNQQGIRWRPPERNLVPIIVHCIDAEIPQRCNMDYVIAQLNRYLHY